MKVRAEFRGVNFENVLGGKPSAPHRIALRTPTSESSVLGTLRSVSFCITRGAVNGAVFFGIARE